MRRPFRQNLRLFLWARSQTLLREGGGAAGFAASVSLISSANGLCAAKVRAALDGPSFRTLARLAGVSEATNRRTARGNPVNAETYLKLCIALDLNPFEGLVKPENVSREHPTVAPEKGALNNQKVMV